MEQTSAAASHVLQHVLWEVQTAHLQTVQFARHPGILVLLPLVFVGVEGEDGVTVVAVVTQAAQHLICLSNTATPWPLRPMGMEARMVHSSVSGSYTSVDGQPCDSKEARRITHTPPNTYSFPLCEIILWKQRA